MFGKYSFTYLYTSLLDKPYCIFYIFIMTDGSPLPGPAASHWVDTTVSSREDTGWFCRPDRVVVRGCPQRQEKIMIKAFLVDVNHKSARSVEIEPSLDTYYELLECDCIDIAERSVGGKIFDIIVDDEGLMRDTQVISAIDSRCKPMLVGNLLFVHHDREGHTTGLSDSDCEHLLASVHHVRTISDPDGHPCVCNVDYC